MTTMPFLEQAHETYGGDKLVKWIPSPPQRVVKGNVKENNSIMCVYSCKK